MGYQELKDLKFALDSGMFSNDTIEKITNDMIVEEKLNNHKYKVWQNKSNGRYMTYVSTENGDRKLLSKKTRRELANSLENNDKRIARKRPRMIETIFNDWLDRKMRYGDIKPQSYDKYKTDFDRFFKNGVVDISKQPIGTFREIDLEDFIKDTIVHYNLSYKTYGSLRLLIRGIWKHAKRLGKTDLSIVEFFNTLELPKRIFKPKNRNPADNVFTDEEINLIQNYVESLENPSVLDYGVLLAFYTGMRAGEIVALKWEDIDTDVIHITKTEERYKDENGKYLYQVRDSGKTEASTRDLVLTDQAKKILHKLKMINPFGEYIFEFDGRRYISKKLTVRLYQICNKVGIPKRSLHKARKTYITKLINAGVEETVIINQAGHTSFETTRNYYEFNNRTTDEAKEQIKKVFVV